MRMIEDPYHPGLYIVAPVEGASLHTAEPSFAFLSSGPSFTDVVSFASNLKVAAAPSRSQALVATAGRTRPIALFGQSGTLEVSGSATLFEGLGSTPDEVEQFILNAGLVCYRDPTGRRIFGAVTGNVDTPSTLRSEFSYKVTEAS